MVEEKVEYSRFSQYYIQMADHLNELKDEAAELQEEGLEVPERLTNEIFRHTLIKSILTQAGAELYGKSAKQLYKDGWEFWFKEDAELREKNYGK